MQKHNLLKIITAITLTITLLGTLAACGSKTKETDSKLTPTASATGTNATDSDSTATPIAENEFIGDGLNEATVIHVGTQPGVAIWELNKVKSIIEDEFTADNIKVEYQEFTYGPPIIEAISAGDIDFTITGDLPVFTGIANGIGVTGVYHNAFDPQGNWIIVPEGSTIKKIEDLKGKKVAFPVGSGAHNFVGQLLASVNLTIDDIEAVNLATTDIAAALTKGEVDAAALWEPQVSIVAAQAGATKVISSEGVYNSLAFVDVRNDFASQNPELTARFLKAIVKLNTYIKDNTDEVIGLISDSTGIDKELWGTLNRLTYNGYFTDADWKAAEKTKQFLLDNDLITSDFDISLVYTDKYLKEADRLISEEGK